MNCFHKDCWALDKQRRGRKRNWARKRMTGEQYQEARRYSSLIWTACLGKKYRGGVHKLSSFWRTLKINLKDIGLRTMWSQKFSGKGEKWLWSFHKMNKPPVWWFIGCERKEFVKYSIKPHWSFEEIVRQSQFQSRGFLYGNGSIKSNILIVPSCRDLRDLESSLSSGKPLWKSI